MSRAQTWWWFGISLVVALAVATWVGVTGQKAVDRTPERDVIEAAFGQPVTVDGLEFTVERVEVAGSFPSVRRDSEPIRARAGAQLLRLAYRVVNTGAGETPYFCDARAVQDPGGRAQQVWRPEGAFDFELSDSDDVGCRPASEKPDDTPVQVVVAFEVPAQAAHDVVIRVGTEGRPWVQVRP